MSKRKNMGKYILAVKYWDQWLTLDPRTGEWDEEMAQKNVEADRAGAMAALTAAVDECIEQFANNPSCPALDACLLLCDEAKRVGLDSTRLEEKAEHQWSLQRYSSLG